MPPVFLLWGAPALGLVIGSFLNVVVSRLPKMLEAEQVSSFNLCWPPSSCPLCTHRLAWWENIPLLSYIILKGHCRACQGKISLVYPFLEVTTALLMVFCAWRFDESLQIIAAWIFIWLALPLAIIDWQTMLLPDELTGPLLWAGLIANTEALFVPLEDAVWGSVIGYLFFWSVYWAFKILAGKEGLGRGDFKLLAALGAWLGFQVLPILIFMASFLGILIWLTLFYSGKIKRREPMPFGPMLMIAGCVLLFWGVSWNLPALP